MEEGHLIFILFCLIPQTSLASVIHPILQLTFITQESLSPESIHQKSKDGASLVVQWLRICRAMQRTWVRSLVWEDIPHAVEQQSLCAMTTESEHYNTASLCSATREATTMRSLHTTSKSSLHLCNGRKPVCSNEDPSQSKTIK